MPGPMDVHIAEVSKKDEQIKLLRSTLLKVQGYFDSLTFTHCNDKGLQRVCSHGIEAIDVALKLSALPPSVAPTDNQTATRQLLKAARLYRDTVQHTREVTISDYLTKQEERAAWAKERRALTKLDQAIKEAQCG